MKQNTLKITIKKPVSEIFLWLLDPKNTPQWVPSIVKEERSENPTKMGTIYRNCGKDSKWNEYEITEFDENKSFTFSAKDGNYACRYTFVPVSSSETKITYFECVNSGEIDDPFTYDILEKLKKIIENSGFPPEFTP